MENLNEMQNEMVEEVAEEIEEVTETQETAVEEMVDEPAEEIVFDEEACDCCGDCCCEKKTMNPLMIAIIVMGVVIAGLLAYVVYDIIDDSKSNILNADSLFEYYEINKNESEKIKKDVEKNKDKYTEFYNNLGYTNVSGMTIKDYCEKEKIDFETLRAQYNLPVTLTEDCYYDVVRYVLPIWANVDFEVLKSRYGVSEIEVDGKKYELTPDMPFGLAYDEITLIKLVGEERFDLIKEEYGFGDEVTEKTKMKEVRAKMEKVDTQKRIDEEKAAAEMEASAEANDGAENPEEMPEEMTEEEMMAAIEAAMAAEGETPAE